MPGPSIETTAARSPEAHRDGGGVARIVVPYRIVRVTGTNGKTTTSSMIDAVAMHAGEASARVTTVGAWVRGEPTSNESSLDSMKRTLDLAAASGVRTMVLESTSYALSRGAAHELPATVGVFTNLTRDHLGVHGTPEAYLAAKAQLFMTLLPGGVAVVNAADPASALLAEVTPPAVRVVAYAARAVDPACVSLPLALSAARVTVDRRGTRIELAPSPLADRLGGALALRVVGHVHAENALAAAVAADALGYPPEAIREALASFAGVPGRFEQVDRPDGRLVVVDYAHTPDALERTLALARSLVEAEKGRVICVFGCGGDRDRGKRPEMGRVAAELADRVVVTMDNPRGERPEDIAAEILSGVVGRFDPPIRITDRGQAIREAIAWAGVRDIVVIAGKGHEKTQILRDRIVPFDDVEVARSAPSAADGETGRKSRT
ncbi:UDP-N-acetylmuramoylalanyl-D-glutamate--2,6-diaminopimelate ligase [Minicystis rosea]|nr:UDP-N-acetylmuramoylalanyl-D-glutamate--2,6-diaminopimelate ligase [Minicystis rosea]